MVEIQNINTKSYWDHRFHSGNWNKSGQKQTEEYAKANVQNSNIDKNFKGSILDFGCAQGDAIPVYVDSYPNAKISGIDISDIAIKKCKERFGNIAEFSSGDYSTVAFQDIIIASHVMEHLSNDKTIVRDLLGKCIELFVFVPFREDPLYFEHVNYYDENYYKEFEVISTKIFEVSYKIRLPLKSLIKGLIMLKFSLYSIFSKQIIMFHFKGTANN